MSDQIVEQSEDSQANQEGGDAGNDALEFNPYSDTSEYSGNQYIKYLLVRASVVLTALIASFIVPNINILLQFGGALIATVVSVIIPVVFYNRAFNDELKNLQQDSQNKQSLG